MHLTKKLHKFKKNFYFLFCETKVLNPQLSFRCILQDFTEHHITEKEIKNMKILIVLTGGTIGSKTENHIIDTGMKSPYRLIDLYYKAFESDCEFKIIQPFSHLSENFTLDVINQLADTVLKTDTSGYDGIIITHGSDTVSYTGAFLSYVLCSLNCPVVLTASDYPPDDIKSNALKNLRGAVQFIKSGYVKNGVYFSYGNPDENAEIHIATRINEADCFTDKFSSFCGNCFGVIENDEFTPYPNNPSPAEIMNCRQYPHKNFKSNCLILKSFTGMDYRFINLENPDLKSVVNIMYHSATACTYGTDTSFTDFIEKCSKRNIKVYCVSFKNREDLYSSANKIIECGGIPLCNISYQSAYAKILLADSLKNDKLINKNIFFENIR